MIGGIMHDDSSPIPYLGETEVRGRHALFTGKDADNVRILGG